MGKSEKNPEILNKCDPRRCMRGVAYCRYYVTLTKCHCAVISQSMNGSSSRKMSPCYTYCMPCMSRNTSPSEASDSMSARHSIGENHNALSLESTTFFSKEMLSTAQPMFNVRPSRAELPCQLAPRMRFSHVTTALCRTNPI